MARARELTEQRVRTQAQRRKAAAERREQARRTINEMIDQRTATARAHCRNVVVPRLRALIQQDLKGVRPAARTAGLHPSAVEGAAKLPGEATTYDGPTLRTFYQLVSNTEVSADYLLGLSPLRERQAREAIGVLADELLLEVNKRIANQLRVTSEFVSAVHGATGEELIRALAYQVMQEIVEPALEQRRTWIDRRRRRAAGIPPVVPPQEPSLLTRLMGYSTDKEREHYEAEDAAMAALPDPRPTPKHVTRAVARPRGALASKSSPPKAP